MTKLANSAPQSVTLNPRTLRSTLGLVSLFPLVLLTACATQGLVSSTKVVKQPVPPILVLATPAPPEDLKYNRDLVDLVAKYQAALLSCNNDKASIDEMQNKLEEPSAGDKPWWKKLFGQ